MPGSGTLRKNRAFHDIRNDPLREIGRRIPERGDLGPVRIATGFGVRGWSPATYVLIAELYPVRIRRWMLPNQAYCETARNRKAARTTRCQAHWSILPGMHASQFLG